MGRARRCAAQCRCLTCVPCIGVSLWVHCPCQDCCYRRQSSGQAYIPYQGHPPTGQYIPPPPPQNGYYPQPVQVTVQQAPQQPAPNAYQPPPPIPQPVPYPNQSSVQPTAPPAYPQQNTAYPPVLGPTQ